MANTKEVTIYSTSTCSYCVMAKEYFDSHNIAYRSVDVGNDRDAAQEMIMRSGQMGVPVVDIGGDIVVGFQPKVFEQLLRAA